MLDELILHPSSFVTKIRSEWNDEAPERIFHNEKDKSQNKSRQQIEYRLIAGDGRIVGLYPDLTGMVSVNGQNGAGFLPINDLDRVKFVLDAIQTDEPSDVRIDLDLKTWNGQPMRFEADGSSFVIESISKETQKGLLFHVIQLSCIVPEEIQYYLFLVIIDERGKEYQVGGSIDDELREGKRHFKQTLLWSGMDQLPDKLTLKATTVVKRYSGFNWEETIDLR
ncbi:hypothetical protein LJR153_002220 [Paenibacillus sp. LjRoot153]|uniref:hypothetical protein n=1 Tax=Paenibacillus sp. LjRoot153 TaxID=3342270 RepID=UPI003ED029AC